MEVFQERHLYLKESFQALIEGRASEQQLIEFISSNISHQNINDPRIATLDTRALHVFLEQTLVLVAPEGSGRARCRCCTLNTPAALGSRCCSGLQSANKAYEADDEGTDRRHLFPCHLTFDDCHAGPLHTYHERNLIGLRGPSQQLIKHPRVCECILELVLTNLSSSLTGACEHESSSSDNTDCHLRAALKVIGKLNKVCQGERINCRTLAPTRCLHMTLDCLLALLDKAPQKQHLYLEPMLAFALTLADYRLNGSNLKQLFAILKLEQVEQGTVLAHLEQLLSRQYRSLRNIQPLRSINFPTPAKVAEEIELDEYVSKSWHWRLRNKVVAYKRKRARIREQVIAPVEQKSDATLLEDNVASNSMAPKPQGPQITASWLECAFMAPMSNISPLVHNGLVSFSCSLWLSVCGDLFVMDSSHPASSGAHCDLEALNNKDKSERMGYWARLTSTRRQRRRTSSSSSSSNLNHSKPSNASSIKQAANNKRLPEEQQKHEEDEDEDERNEQRDAAEEFRLFPNMTSRIHKPYSNYSTLRPETTPTDHQKQPPRSFLGRRAKENAQEVLMHLVSFGIDATTIEIWLNIRNMTFCARSCRVTRDGQSILLDQVNFSSHLASNGSWSHIMFCFEEIGQSQQHQMSAHKAMSIRTIVNGLWEEKEKLNFSLHNTMYTNFACLIGCERSTYGYVWKLSQISIYKQHPSSELILFLLGKGPDFWTISNLRQASNLPLADICQRSPRNLLKPNMLQLYRLVDTGRALNWLVRNIQLAFVAHQPNHFIDYSSTLINSPVSSANASSAASSHLNNNAERFIQAKILNFSRCLRVNSSRGFAQALVEAGGIESVLVCFADLAVRRNPITGSSSSSATSTAFSVLLLLVQSHQQHLNKFLDEMNGLKLVEFILVHPECSISKKMLDHYWSFVVMKKGPIHLLKSTRLIFHLMSCWRSWHKDLQVAKEFYRRLIMLVKSSDSFRIITSDQRALESYYINHNLEMLLEAGAIDILMSILRECLVSLDDVVPAIDHETVELIVNLLSLLIKHPPGLDVMLDVVEFLLFLHPDSKAYIEIVPEKINFLMPLMETLTDELSVSPLTDLPRNTAEAQPVESNAMYEMSTRRQVSSRLNRKYRYSQETLEESLSELGEEEEYEEEENSSQFTESEWGDNLTDIIYQHNILLSTTAAKRGQFEWPQTVDKKSTNAGRQLATETGVMHQEPAVTRCSPRNLAIANIADMLASIVKLISSEPKKVLAEALQKSILDPEKLILLANNESEFVREKALRLFLYCIRACYSLNLKQVIVRYEEEVKGGFKLCIPIQLMKSLLLNYPATMKMVQLCYGIIVGLEDFETIESVCLMFDIETLDNNLQLNTFILLINIMTQLKHPKDLVATLRFVNAFLKQLLNLQRDEVISILIEQDLIEILLKVYFRYVEYKISRAHHEQEEEDNYEQVKRELDSIMILVVRYFSEHLTGTNSRKSIEDLLSCFDLLNSYVPSKFHHLMRDRKVMILLVVLSYCKSYEKTARDRASVVGIFSGLKSLLRKDNSSIFVNSLSDSQMDLDAMDGYSFSNNTSRGSSLNQNETQLQIDLHQECDVGSELSGSIGEASMEDVSVGQEYNPATQRNQKRITEPEVVERFKMFFSQSTRFILTRDEGVIPSPAERGFIIKTLHLLASYISEHNQVSESRRSNRSHLSSILFKLEPHAKLSFSRLILFLLSPGDWTNMDERKYFAVKLMDMFSPEQLLDLLTSKSVSSTYKLLGIFIRQLINYQQPSESLSSEEEADREVCEMFDDKLIGDDTEDKLKLLVEYLDFRLDFQQQTSGSNAAEQQRAHLYHARSMDAKICDIWMSELAQIRQENVERSGELLYKQTSIITTTGTPHQKVNDKSGSGDAALTRLLADAIRVTREVVADKHEHRKAYLEDLKQNKLYNYNVRQQWLSLIIGQSHERAPWYLESHYPRSWELNPVEGPSRIRRRLRPCKLRLASRFRRRQDASDEDSRRCQSSQHDSSSFNDLDQETGPVNDDSFNHYCPHPLYSMILSQGQPLDSNELRVRMFTRDKISFNCDCSIIRGNEVCLGEISIASWCIHFIGDRLDNHQAIASPASHTPVHMGTRMLTGTTNSGLIANQQHSASPHLMATTQSPKPHQLHYNCGTTVVEDLWFDEIVEIWDRRYQLQDVGLEIFLTNNMTYLLSFRSAKDKDEFRQNLMRIQHKMINLQRYNLNTSLQKISQLWRDGKLTNFDYLTCLNKLAGRSFNDLMQYPVFPFVLSNYETDELDLEDPKNFRNLERPMAVQNRDKEVFYVSNYNYLHRSSNLSLNSLSKPYHYGNHYSNSATVLHFLVRLPPFTQMLIQYQDNNFDQPDRTFHSIASTWRLITRDSNTDFKELIPEFFFLPEMFVNFEKLELGRKQNDELVDDVQMPAWCPHSDPRLFTLIHRQALECRYVRENLNHWIDLVFGYKQTGKAAVEAINVFHPATYYGMINLNEAASTTSQTGSSSMSSALATISARSSAKNSGTTVDIMTQQQQHPNDVGSLRRLKSPAPVKYQQVDIERLALETMIRTYGQMPRQLFSQPAKQLSSNPSFRLLVRSSGSQSAATGELQQPSNNTSATNGFVLSKSRIEPLKQVHGLKWGSYVGSPDGLEIKVVKHRKLVLEDLALSKELPASSTKYRPRIKLCLLPNGDIAIMKENTSLILDYRADRKSLGDQQASFVSRKYFRRAGLSNIGREMNLFSSMIISRQQFSYIDLNSLPTDSSHSTTSHSMSLSLGPRCRFSPDSLSLVSWHHLDGTIRIRSSALTKARPSVPLVQGDFIVDSVSVCSSVPELNLLFVGYQSGTIGAHIVSSSMETAPITSAADSGGSISSLQSATEEPKAAAASAIHFLHTTTSSSSNGSELGANAPLGPGRVQGGPSTYSPLKLAGKTLHSVQTLNRTSRWLYCHTKPVSCIKINVSFGVVISGSEDGTLVVWDLNSLTYVRTLHFRAPSSPSKGNHHSDYLCTCAARQCSSDSSNHWRLAATAATQEACVCRIGVSLIASSDTLGDIVSTKDISSRMAGASCDSVGHEADGYAKEEEEDLSSILYCHTINGSLVGLVDCHAQVTAVAYSAAPEGVSVNVIVVGLADGLIRMYSSWDLTRVQEFHLQHLSAPICSIVYSRDNQLLYLAYQDSQVAVLRNKKVALAREWLL